mgnify:CR=1 FL=1
MSKRLSGRVAIVTGAAEGIGNAIAELFCQHGAKVCVAGTNVVLGNAFVERMVEQGLEAEFVQTDVADKEAILRMVNHTVLLWGTVDVLVNNAGFIQRNFDVAATPDQDWQAMFDVNLRGMWHCCQAVIPHMKASGSGSIVNMGSVHSFKEVPNTFPYPVTKHAIIGLTRSLAVEFGEHNIRVNVICPGTVETPNAMRTFARADDPKEARQNIAAIHPLKRNASMQEIAYPALFLASQESSFMTGESMVVDGGRSVVYNHPA